MPDPDEMDAAFDGPDDDDHEHESRGLLTGQTGSQRVPGEYDFERDYVGRPTDISPPS